MRILLTTEGTYPSIMGGVSTWCDQLISGLAGYRFELLEITNPFGGQSAYRLPPNVAEHRQLRLWSPYVAYPVARHVPAAPRRRTSDPSFARAYGDVLAFLDDDLERFGDGLFALAKVRSSVDLWSALLGAEAWEQARAALTRLATEAVPIGVVATAVSWLRGVLAPLVVVPTATDQAHSTSAGLSAIPAYIAARAHGVPLMVTEHGLYLRERYLGLSSTPNPPLVKQFQSRFYRSLARLIYARADLVVSVSEFNRMWQIELGAPAARTRVVYNGVAPEGFPVADNAAQPRPTVTWIGRVDPVKDLDTLIRSMATLREEQPGALLRLFGPVPRGNERYAATLRERVDALRLSDHVRFEGPITPAYKAYHAGDVVALSSISEGFPYVAIEAMMCARPVVATQVGGVAEAVGPCGAMVEPRNPVALATALLQVLRDPTARAALGTAARQRALELFTLDRMLAGYGALYGELGATGAWAVHR